MQETISLSTKLLLLGGMIGPLLFIVVFLIEGATRPGYSPRRYFVSELSLGKRGWIQIANFIVCGLLILAATAGIAQVWPDAIWGDVLLGIFGLSVIAAGVFVTDPVLYFPPELSDKGPTLHGKLHNAGFPVSFGSLFVAILLVSWQFFANGNLAWALYSLASALAFIACAALMIVTVARAMQGNPEAPVGLWQRAAIVVGWIWLAALTASLLWQVW